MIKIFLILFNFLLALSTCEINQLNANTTNSRMISQQSLEMFDEEPAQPAIVDEMPAEVEDMESAPVPDNEYVYEEYHNNGEVFDEEIKKPVQEIPPKESSENSIDKDKSNVYEDIKPGKTKAKETRLEKIEFTLVSSITKNTLKNGNLIRKKEYKKFIKKVIVNSSVEVLIRAITVCLPGKIQTISGIGYFIFQVYEHFTGKNILSKVINTVLFIIRLMVSIYTLSKIKKKIKAPWYVKGIIYGVFSYFTSTIFSMIKENIIL